MLLWLGLAEIRTSSLVSLVGECSWTENRNGKIKSEPQPEPSDTSDSLEHQSDGDDQRQQEVRAHTSASWGESRPILIQELQGHAVGPTEAQLW